MDTKITQTNQEIKDKTDSTTNENRTLRRKRKQKTMASAKKESEKSEAPQTSQQTETTQSILSTNLPDLEAPLSIQSSILVDSRSETAINESERTKTLDLEAPKVVQSPEVFDLHPETATNESSKTKTDDDVIRDYVNLTTNADSIPPSANETSEAHSVEEKPIADDSFCNRYFGYLGQRDKGEQIPEHCFGCSKSIECMLESNESSNKKVAGIKQWYFSQ